MIKRFVLVLGLIIASIGIGQGCSAYMAATQPDKKNIALFQEGTHRKLLLAEFGQPIISETRKDGKKYEIFSFVQGYSKANKTGRAFAHGAADFLTLGMWEVVGTPAETVFTGTKMAYEVQYSDEGIVEQVLALSQPK